MKNKNTFQKLAAIYFVAMLVFWGGLALTHHKAGNLNYLFSFLFGLIPLLGGLVAQLPAASLPEAFK